MNLAILGTGKMARAIVSSILSASNRLSNEKNGSIDQIIGVGRNDASRDAFLALESQRNRLHWTAKIDEAIQNADVVLISVKPQQMEKALSELAAAVFHSKLDRLYLSIAAGITLDWIELKFLQAGLQNMRLIRAMPNTPITIGYGVTALVAGKYVRDRDRDFCEMLFGAGGKVYWTEEEKMDIVTALSGSGPAYFYKLIEALAAAAKKAGLKPSIALEMAAVTARGAAEMVLQTKHSPYELILQVASKGGTTAAALAELDQAGWSQVCQNAFEAARKRAGELSREVNGSR